MALSSRLKLWEQKGGIKEEKTPVPAAEPPPPLSAVPGGFLKQLVRETEKETKLKEPESKEERSPNKLSDNLVQQFLLPDETPPILEAEMIKQEVRQKAAAETTKQQVEMKPEKKKNRKEVRDVWYEAGTVWYVHKDGYTLATQLKPDEGTPELPEGRARVKLQTDGSLHDVTEDQIQKVNPTEMDLCEDLSDLQSVNESSVLHTLSCRARNNQPLTHSGPNIINLWPPIHSKTPKSRRGECVWDAPPALSSLVKSVYVSMVGTRRDHSVCVLGRSGTGKTSTSQSFTLALLRQAGTTGGKVTLERVQAMFTVLRSFGCVSSPHSDASTRFASVFSLDFNHAGQAAAGHLQTMMLDKWKVCQKTEGESNFLVFSQLLAGVSTEMKYILQKN
ncbi:hypothetical protein JOQ06_029586 [Pogonophryne albipinna]|uniref:Myosin motor domain-containing protein n=1 Tax=Pogonophryne albipinna TaxID=1090488 RepID=A0AAD6AER6_9TELE|nr:hypothetical protein JOQ06_029586 [Pogonophryne albipinna]